MIILWTGPKNIVLTVSVTISYAASVSTTPSRSITLTKDPTVTGNENIALSIVASGAVNMPNEIFKYLQKPINNMDISGKTVIFLGVCQPSDMIELPVGGPDTGDNLTFRSSTVDEEYDTIEEATAAWNSIKTFTMELIASLDGADKQTNPETFVLAGST